MQAKSSSAVSHANMALICADRIGIVAPSDTPMQARARTVMMRGVAGFNYAVAVRLGIIFA